MTRFAFIFHSGGEIPCNSFREEGSLPFYWREEHPCRSLMSYIHVYGLKLWNNNLLECGKLLKMIYLNNYLLPSKENKHLCLCYW